VGHAVQRKEGKGEELMMRREWKKGEEEEERSER